MFVSQYSNSIYLPNLYRKQYFDYLIDLLNLIDYPYFNIEQTMEILFDCIISRNKNILTYKDKICTSVITNTIAKQHHTTWIKELRHCLEDFIQK
ncbi:unnamed protein product [Adineta steineri]|uniref:Uncharacterized protein n=1 Tax=Adineta steineri TaxID=433720 RepID=A0A815QE06_9BILA|nr:unnamed protein product [Adineta steineri]CAF3994939.1 unnamed protein product [Adineta steineri]